MSTYSRQAATAPDEPFGGGKDELVVAEEQCSVSFDENGCTIQSCADGEEDVIFFHYASECVGLREVREMAVVLDEHFLLRVSRVSIVASKA